MKISLTLDDKLMAQAMVALDAGTHADAITLALQRVAESMVISRFLHCAEHWIAPLTAPTRPDR